MNQPIRRMRLLMAAAVLTLSLWPDSGASAQAWLGWTAYWENDSFQKPITGSDEAYTNGVRIAAVRNPARNFSWVDSLGKAWRNTWLVRDSYTDRNVHPAMSVVLGQNFFTPTVITDVDVDPLDRPYAGILYLGVRLDLTEDPQKLGGGVSWTLQHSLEGDVGIMGPSAFGGEVQTGVHTLRTSRIPKGWDNQLGFDPLLQASYTVRGRLGGRFLDFTPHVGMLVGNPQTSAYGGATARIGINLSGFPSLLIPMNVYGVDDTRPNFELSFLAGFEGRAFAHNALLGGGIVGDDPLAVPLERLVADLRLGGSLRVTDWRLSYTWVRRTGEVKTGPFAIKDHDYGSLSLSYEPYGSVPGSREGTFIGSLMDDILGTVFQNFLFEAGLGTGESEVPGLGEQKGTGMHVAAARGFLGNRLFFGAEMNGIGREGPAPLPGQNHSDEFLTSLLGTVRVRPLGRTTGPGIFHIRAGMGAGTHTLQILAPLDGRVDTCPPGTTRDGGDGLRCSAKDTGTAVMLGAGYALSIGSQVSVGLDVSWNRLSLDSGKETFITPAVTMRYHPNG